MTRHQTDPGLYKLQHTGGHCVRCAAELDALKERVVTVEGGLETEKLYGKDHGNTLKRLDTEVGDIKLARAESQGEKRERRRREIMAAVGGLGTGGGVVYALLKLLGG